jgi:opine dehydrogenase
MAEVIKDAHLIMVTTPTQYHKAVAREMAASLEDGQIIVLNPGRTFGTHVFCGALRRHGCRARVIVAEAETFVFACRCARIAEPYIYGIKENVRVAAHNPADTPAAVGALRRLFPSILPAASTLHTSFANIGMIFHPLPILLNITRIEAKEKFLYYMQGISPLVANILDRMDEERLAVAGAYGVEPLSAFDWLKEHYGSEGETLYDRIQSTPAYANILAPIDIDTRYIYEDMLTGCVPFYCAGAAAGVDTPIIKSAILWASTVYATDFMQNGRNENDVDFSAVAGQSRPAGPNG